MIFEHWLFQEMILPFLLVFVLFFAVLQKTKILGENKNQIDALISLVIGLILIGFPQPRDLIVGIMPWFSVAVVVVLVFLLLYGFVAGEIKADEIPGWMKITFGVLAGVFTIGVVAYVSGFWKWVEGWLSGGSSGWVANAIFIVVIVGALVAVLASGKNGSSGND